MRSGLLALAAAVALAACEDRPAALPARSGPSADPAGGSGSLAAPPPERPPSESPAERPRLPATAILVSATAVEPAARVALDPAVETVVDPGASFEVVLAARVEDARLVLLDPQEAHLPAAGTSEVGQRTTLALSPAAHLVPGSRCLLRLEGAVERELHGADGRAFEPLTFALLVSGTPPPPEPPRRSKRRRR